MNNCPWCGFHSVGVTTAQDMRGFDRRPRYLCTGPQSHEWREGDGPIPEPEPKPTFIQKIKQFFS
jgi:hypothetical protein